MNTNHDSQPVCPQCGAAIPAEAPLGLCPKCVLSQAATAADDSPNAAATDEIPTLDRVARAFPNLEVIELIGRGGMGFVFKARQPHLDRFVALKLLPDRLAKDPQFAERFNREGRVLARLNHPNIVSVFDFGRTEDFYYLMMEHVDGVNLRQAMRAGKFSPQEALNVVPHICEALQYAHEQGILHRDIKPENILLDTKGRVKIADFGIAKLVGEDAGPHVTLTNTGAALGTPHYMAPEQLEHPADVDHRADIYSLGVVFYEMLTGELPIGRFEAPSSKTPVGKGVDDVVFRALEKNRERRQRSASEFKTQVETAGAGEVPPQLERSTPGATSFSRSAIIGAGLVGLSLFGLVFLSLALAGGGGFALPELIILGLPMILCIVSGTVLGWMGLSEIRRSSGAKIGLPLALFAAVAYPFGLPALLAVVGPSLVIVGANGGPRAITRLIIFALIAGFVSATIWGVVAVARWAGNRPRGQHWSTRGWAITSAAFMIVMLLFTQPPKSSQNRLTERVPSPMIERVAEAERLPAGTVELLAVAQHPSNEQWWKPDGSAWAESPFQNPGHTVTPNAEQRGIELVFRHADTLPTDAAIQFELEGSAGWSGGNHVLREGRDVPNSRIIAALFPRTKSTANVLVGIADGPWETSLEEDSRSQGSSSFTRDGRPIHIEFLGAVENNKGDTVVTIAHDIDDQQLRLVAVDAGGNETPSLLVSQTATHLTATFVKLPLTDIQKIRLQVRPFRWAVFAGVALEPREGNASTASLTLPGVRVNFQNVNLRQERGHDRLDLVFGREDNNAELSWRSDGRFDGAPVDMREATVVNATTGEAVITHTMSLLLPDNLARADKLQLLRRVRERWQGNSLVVQPHAEHEIIRVAQPGGHDVVITLIGRESPERRQ